MWVEFFDGYCGTYAGFINIAGGWKRLFFWGIRWFGSGPNLKANLACRFAIHSALKDPISRRSAFRQWHFPEAGETWLSGVVIKTGHCGELAVRTLHAPFAMVHAPRAFPFKINDDFTIVGNIKDGAWFGHNKISVALFAFCSDNRTEEPNLRA